MFSSDSTHQSTFSSTYLRSVYLENLNFIHGANKLLLRIFNYDCLDKHTQKPTVMTYIRGYLNVSFIIFFCYIYILLINSYNSRSNKDFWTFWVNHFLQDFKFRQVLVNYVCGRDGRKAGRRGRTLPTITLNTTR